MTQTANDPNPYRMQVSPPTSSRLLIFEGIMGSGKSTATRRFSERLAATGLQVAAYTEAADPHPVRASDDLVDFFQPWLEIEAQQLATLVREKWARYVGKRLQDDVFTVMDGQLFHGDLSNLFMMEMSADSLAVHMNELMRVLAPLRPTVVYFHQADVVSAIRTVCVERGAKWEAYQVTWKLKSPYATRRQLAGLDGLISLYQDYRALTDALFQSLACTKLAVQTVGADWQACYRQIENVIE